MLIDYRSIGQNIKVQRKKCGYTQEQLSKKLSVTVSYVSQIERGIAKTNLEILAKIADALQCDIPQLLTGVATQHETYLQEAFMRHWQLLDQTQRRIIIDVMRSLIKHG